MGRTVRVVVFIILITVFYTAISSAGIYLTSRFGLTQSREQVPLTVLYLGNEGKVELPGHGKMVEGNRWRLKNSRGSCTLTLNNAVIENTAEKNAIKKNTPKESAIMENVESPRPEISVTGDLIIELEGGSDSWIRSEDTGIRIHSSALVIWGRGSLGTEAGTAGILGNRVGNSQAALRLENGQLDVKGTCAGISCPEVNTAEGTSVVLASGRSGIELYSCRLRIGESEGEIATEGSCAAVLASGSGEMEPSIKVGEKTAAGPGNVRIVELGTARLENTADREEEIGGWMGGACLSLLTYLSESMVTYDEDTFCFDGSVETTRFAAK